MNVVYFGCALFFFMQKAILCLFTFLMFCNICSGQDSQFKSFVPNGFTVLDTTSGDLNQDGKADVVLILRNKLEKENPDTTRPLLLLLGNGKGGYSLAARNDSAVLCLGCGGVFGDPYVRIAIKKNYFSIEHYGGSSWRWTRVITFKFDSKSKRFVLHRDAGYSWHASDSNKQTENIYSKADFGKLPFEKYSYEKGM